jgi:hypothetical protein
MRQGAVVLLLLLAACTSGGPAARPGLARPPAAVATTPAPVVYAAIGASETAGIGAADPRRQAWPTVFYLTALPPTAVYYNLGIQARRPRPR